MRNLILFFKILPILKIEVGFFPIEKLLHKTIFLANFIISELIMSEVSKDLRNIFFPKYPRFWNLKSDFFPLKKSFLQIFQNTTIFFHLNFISKKNPKNQRNFFDRSGGRSGGSQGAHYHRFAPVGRVGGSQLGVHRLLHSLHPSPSPFSLPLSPSLPPSPRRLSLSLSPSSSLSL